MCESLRIYTIYDSPLDFPDQFVTRGSTVTGGGSVAHDLMPAAVVRSLETARAAVPPGLHRLDRHPDDDPVIVEVWL